MRSLRDPDSPVSTPPADGLSWRTQIRPSATAPTLGAIAADLWQRGIPIVPLDVLPAPSFQGIACIVESRPVILLGHRHDEPGRAALLIAHEAGHIAAGDCAPDQPVVDEEEEILDDAEIERKADEYARRVLLGRDSAPAIHGNNFRELAREADKVESETGADAGAVIFAWARQTLDYSMATRAVQALYRGSGARRQLRQLFDRYVDLDAATESDRALLRCAYGDPAGNEARL